MIEPIFRLLKTPLRKNSFVQFVPQAIAFAFAEWYSREITDYPDVFEEALESRKKAGRSENTTIPYPKQAFSSMPLSNQQLFQHKPQPDRPSQTYLAGYPLMSQPWRSSAKLI